MGSRENGLSLFEREARERMAPSVSRVSDQETVEKIKKRSGTSKNVLDDERIDGISQNT
jgi:hypothetical protein